MADLDYITHYSTVSPDSEILNRPDKRSVQGQADFLAIASALKVPILSARNNMPANSDLAGWGSGLSFAVLRSTSEYRPSLSYDFVGGPPTHWFKHTKYLDSLTIRRHVMKRIISSTEGDVDDARQLASITNEIRVLGSKSLRRHQNVVSLLFISWQESPIHGRFWPQVALEYAEFGTLGDFLQSRPPEFRTKVTLGLDIVKGLNYLHLHKVVHCDLKPHNILIFADAERTRFLRVGIDPVVAKLCDFGCAVIMADYPSDAIFRKRIGSFPWMSPELDLVQPIKINMLPKADIFSFGLVMASIFMNGATPFDGMDQADIIKSKQVETAESMGSAYSIVLANIRRLAPVIEGQEPLAKLLLSHTLAFRPGCRSRWEPIFYCLKLALCLGSENGERTTTQAVSLSKVIPSDKCEMSQASNSAAEVTLSGNQHESMSGRKTPSETALASILALLPRENPMDGLLHIFFEAQTLQPDPNGAIEPIVAFSKMDGEDHDISMGHDWDKESNFCTDFAYEPSLRSALLPSVAAKEVFGDLKAQVDNDRFKDSRMALELAACYFNGSLTDTNFDLGIKYFSMATMLKDSNAIGSAMNVFDASDRDIPPPIRDIVIQTLNEAGWDGILPTISDLVTPLFPVTIDHAKVRANTWARVFPADYVTLISGDERHTFNSAIVKLFRLSDLSKLAEAAQSSATKTECLKSYNMRGFGHEKLSVESAVFVNEVRQLNCLNCVDKFGLTLLQTAVVRNDFPMVKILVCELGADVNTIGSTAGWTPLWLSCLLGYHDIAMFLRINAADPTCRDTDQGTTILHTLSQFSEASQVEAIIDMALGGGLDINICNSNDMTPLHTTFIGWDYSKGAAARVLLAKGADPTRQAPDQGDFVTPISLCLRNLDFNLLHVMAAAAKDLPNGRRNLAIAKVQAFRWLLSQTRFYFMCVVGKHYEAALESVLRIIVDADMMNEFQSDKYTSGGSHIFSACHFGRGHIVKALLKVFPEVDLDSVENDPMGERSCLQFAIERRSQECVQILLDKGAGILYTTQTGQNALHAAAKSNPILIPKLVDQVKAMSLEERGGKTIKEILDMRTEDGACVFGMLLWEGYSVDLVESLRSEYDLDYDSLVDYGGGNLSTFTDLTIVLVVQGLIPINLLYYLLKLSPQPRFVCRGDGSTLLTRAVMGQRNYKHSHNSQSHELIRLILNKYPAYENLSMGDRGIGSLHMAAFFSNWTAIRIIQDHVGKHYPDQEVPYNVTTDGGDTVLDYSAEAVKGNTTNGEESQQLDAPLLAAHRERAIKCYQLLRKSGALHWFERRGIMIMCWATWMTLAPLNKLVVFMQRVSGKYLLSKPKFIPNVIVLEEDKQDSDSASKDSERLKIHVIELVWLFDNFCLRGYEFHTSPQRATKRLSIYYAKRRSDDRSAISKTFGFALDQPPYTTASYVQSIPDTNESVHWSRSGRVWAESEVRELSRNVMNEWNLEFGAEPISDPLVSA